MAVGYKLGEMRFEGRKPSLKWRMLYWLGWLFLFRALKDRLGVSRLRSASTGGAALGPDVFRFFHAIGVPLRQLSGQTGISGISCIHPAAALRFPTLANPTPGTQGRHTWTAGIPSK